MSAISNSIYRELIGHAERSAETRNIIRAAVFLGIPSLRKAIEQNSDGNIETKEQLIEFLANRLDAGDSASSSFTKLCSLGSRQLLLEAIKDQITILEEEIEIDMVELKPLIQE